MFSHCFALDVPDSFSISCIENNTHILLTQYKHQIIPTHPSSQILDEVVNVLCYFGERSSTDLLREEGRELHYCVFVPTVITLV